MKRLTSLAVAAVLAAETSFALADLPVGAQGTANAAARGSGSLQRALDSRAALLQRAGAGGRAQTGADAGTQGGASAQADAAARAGVQAGAVSRGGAGARANGGVGVGVELGGSSGRPDLRPSVQTGTGRLARELVRNRLGTLRSRTDLSGVVDARGEVSQRGRSDHGGRPEFDGPADGSGDRPGTGIVTVGGEVVARGRAQALANADRQLARRLAEIDRLRDLALETGDEQLLQRADRFEAIARWQHEHRFAVDAGTPRPMNSDDDAERAPRPFGRPQPFGRLSAESETETEVGSSAVVAPSGPAVQAQGGIEASTSTQVEAQTSAGN